MVAVGCGGTMSFVCGDAEPTDSCLEDDPPHGETSDVVSVDVYLDHLPCAALPQQTCHSPHTVAVYTVSNKVMQRCFIAPAFITPQSIRNYDNSDSSYTVGWVI